MFLLCSRPRQIRSKLVVKVSSGLERSFNGQFWAGESHLMPVLAWKSSFNVSSRPETLYLSATLCHSVALKSLLLSKQDELDHDIRLI